MLELITGKEISKIKLRQLDIVNNFIIDNIFIWAYNKMI